MIFFSCSVLSDINSEFSELLEAGEGESELLWNYSSTENCSVLDHALQLVRNSVSTAAPTYIVYPLFLQTTLN